MTTVFKFFYATTFILLLAGCNKQTAPKAVQPKKENPPIQKTTQKKENPYKDCKKHFQVMDHASTYIQKEFQEGYFVLNDVAGAKAQVFLIESNSPTIYAQNINAALKSYQTQYDLAQKNKCDMASYNRSFLDEIKDRIIKLENQNEEKEK